MKIWKKNQRIKNFYGLTIRYPGTGPVPVPEVYKTATSAVAQARTVQVPHMGRQPPINKPEHVQEQEVLPSRTQPFIFGENISILRPPLPLLGEAGRETVPIAEVETGRACAARVAKIHQTEHRDIWRENWQVLVEFGGWNVRRLRQPFWGAGFDRFHHARNLLA
jgi:hypothetical protein